MNKVIITELEYIIQLRIIIETICSFTLSGKECFIFREDGLVFEYMDEGYAFISFIIKNLYGVDPYYCDTCSILTAPNRPNDNKGPFCKQQTLRFWDMWR